jgi:hypothetical protein
MRETSALALSTLVAVGVLLTPVTGLSDTQPASPATQQAAASQEAPVDGYFGHYGQSVLEVRNRIVAIQGQPDTTLRTADGLGSIEHVDDAVAVWKAQYPHDPWLAAVLAHLFECYVRAGKAHSAHATALLESLVANFPDSKESDEALRIFARADLPAEAAPAVQTVTTVLAGRVIDALTATPVAGALVLVSDGTSNDPAGTPFATSAADGSFHVSGVTSQAKFLVVDPPHGSQYTVYRTPFAGQTGDVIVKLSAPPVPPTAVAKP